MNVIKYFSPLLKEPKLIDDLPIVIRVRKFDEVAAKEFSTLMMKAQNTGQPVAPVIVDSYGGQIYSLMHAIYLLKDVSKVKCSIIEISHYILELLRTWYTLPNEKNDFIRINLLYMIDKLYKYIAFRQK